MLIVPYYHSTLLTSSPAPPPSAPSLPAASSTPSHSESSRASSSSSSTPPSCLKGKELPHDIQIKIFTHLLRSENVEVQSKQLSQVRCLKKDPTIRKQALFALMDRGEIFLNALDKTEKRDVQARVSLPSFKRKAEVHHRTQILIDLINCNDTENLTLDEEEIAMLAGQCEQIKQLPPDKGSHRSVIDLIRSIAVKNPKKADELLIGLVNAFIIHNYDPLYLLEEREFNIIENNLEKISFENCDVSFIGIPWPTKQASIELIRIISKQNKKKGVDLLLKFVNTAPVSVIRECSPSPWRLFDHEQRETIIKYSLELQHLNPVLIDQSLCLEILKYLYFYYPNIAEKLFITYINNFGDFLSIRQQYPQLLSRKSYPLIKNLCVHNVFMTPKEQSTLVHDFPNLESLVIDLKFKSLRSSTLKTLVITAMPSHQPLHLDTPALKDLKITGGINNGFTQVTGNLSALQKLDIDFLLRLTSLPPLPEIRTLRLHICPVLNNIPEIISGAPHLHTMNIDDCNHLTAFHDIPMPHLQRAFISNCASLVSFFSPSHVPCLTDLEFIGCPQLKISPELVLRTPEDCRTWINGPAGTAVEEWLKADADPDPAHISKKPKSSE